MESIIDLKVLRQRINTVTALVNHAKTIGDDANALWSVIDDESTYFTEYWKTNGLPYSKNLRMADSVFTAQANAINRLNLHGSESLDYYRQGRLQIVLCTQHVWELA